MSSSLIPVPKVAAAVLVFRDGKVLAVSRKNNPSDFGLVGGSVEKDETTVNAAIRELKEETGLAPKTLTTDNIHLVYANDDGFGYVVYTYLIDEVVGTINTTEQGKVAWVEPKVLLDGSFGHYNAQVFNAIGLDTRRMHERPNAFVIAYHALKRFIMQHFFLINFFWLMALALWCASITVNADKDISFLSAVLFVGMFVGAIANFALYMAQSSD